MIYRTVISAMVCLLGMCLVSNGAEPTLEDILKAWEEREKAYVSLQMTWKEKAFVPKGAINQCYGRNGKTNIAGVDVPNPFPETDKVFESKGTLAMSKTDLICEFNSPRFSFLDKARIRHESYRVLLQDNSSKMLDINENTQRPPAGFEGGRTALNEPNNNLIRFLTIFARARGGKDWNLWDLSKKTLVGERPNPEGGDSLLLIESEIIQYYKVAILTEKAYPFLPKTISVILMPEQKINWDIHIKYTDNQIPKSYICNLYHKSFLEISYDVEFTSWETSKLPLDKKIFNVEYPIHTLINKKQPDGSTKLYGIAKDGSEHELDRENLSLTRHEQLENKARTARRSNYTIFGIGLLALILLCFVGFRRYKNSTLKLNNP